MRTGACIDCGTPVTFGDLGPVRLRCPGCSADRKKKLNRQKSRRYYYSHIETVRAAARDYGREQRRVSPEKMRAKDKAYRARHLEQKRAADRAYAATHREETRAKARAWRLANLERAKATERAYKKAHPEKERERRQRLGRRPEAREKKRIWAHHKRTLVGSFGASDLALMMKHQKGRCWWCGQKLAAYHIDHRIPASKGGSNDPSNLVLSCPTCNVRKNAKMPLEFAGRLL